MHMQQLAFDWEIEEDARGMERTSIDLLPLDQYHKVLVSSSGGKDSVACLLHLLELGVPREKIELWHQCVDGAPTQERVEFLDWPVSESYVQALGDVFDLPVRYQWRDGGIRGELLRKDSLTGDVYYVADDGQVVQLPTTKGKLSTRRKWPAMSADLSVRWCSASAKIDVFKRVLNNHPDFQIGTKDQPQNILVVTGERREESPARARYAESENHACHTRARNVHAWRPVIDWPERKVWEIIERHRIMPHPAYLVGFGRTSCLGCIFSTPDLWAMIREFAPARFERLVQMERELDHTIDAKMDLTAKANFGSLKRVPNDVRLGRWIETAMSRNITKRDLVVSRWELPAGAFRGAAGGSM